MGANSDSLYDEDFLAQHEPRLAGPTDQRRAQKDYRSRSV